MLQLILATIFSSAFLLELYVTTLFFFKMLQLILPQFFFVYKILLYW
jgi:hypothetical protein